MELRQLWVAPIFGVLGVPATVTRPDDAPIATTVIWVTPVMEDLPVGSDEFSRREPRKVLALRRDQVSTVPRGTVIEAPERKGGCSKVWKVDGLERQDSEHHRVIVIKTLDC